MKKRLIFVFLSVVLMLCFGLFACSPAEETSSPASGVSSDVGKDTNDIIIADETVFYDFVNTEAFGFNFLVFSKEPLGEPESVVAEGENIDKITLKVNDDTFDDTFENFKSDVYRGYYSTILGFTGKSSCDSFSINKLTVKIGGKEIVINPKYPVVHNSMTNELNDDFKYVSDFGRPLMITSSGINRGIGTYQYGFDAYEDITVTGLRTCDVLAITNTEFKMDGKIYGELSNLVPYPIKKGQSFSIGIQYDYPEDVPQKDGFGIWTSVILDYKIKDGSEHSLYVPLIIQPVSNISEAHALLDYYLDR